MCLKKTDRFDEQYWERDLNKPLISSVLTDNNTMTEQRASQRHCDLD